MKLIRTTLLILAAIITAAAASAAPKATIQKAWLKHNVMYAGQKCIAIHGKISIEGLKNKKAEIAAYVMKEKGKGHPDTNGKFRSSDGFVSVGETVKVPYETTNWGDFILYLPNEEVHPEQGRGIYYIRLFVNAGNDHLAQSEYLPFVASSLADNTEDSENFNPDVKIWKEDESKKGFTLVTEMPDGTQTRVKWFRCDECKGYLNCQRCSGTGRCKACGGKRGTASTDALYIECVECNKTGKCRRCEKHVGKCRCTTGEYPGFVLEQDPDYTPEAGGEWWKTI